MSWLCCLSTQRLWGSCRSFRLSLPISEMGLIDPRICLAGLLFGLSEVMHVNSLARSQAHGKCSLQVGGGICVSALTCSSLVLPVSQLSEFSWVDQGPPDTQRGWWPLHSSWTTQGPDDLQRYRGQKQGPCHVATCPVVSLSCGMSIPGVG